MSTFLLPMHSVHVKSGATVSMNVYSALVNGGRIWSLYIAKYAGDGKISEDVHSPGTGDRFNLLWRTLVLGTLLDLYADKGNLTTNLSQSCSW